MMNYMLARTSTGKKKRKHYSLILKQKKPLTERKLPTISESVSYHPEAHLENGEWFKIEKTKELGIKNEIIESNFNNQSYNRITKKRV